MQGLGTLSAGIVAARVSQQTTGEAVSSPYFLPRRSCVLLESSFCHSPLPGFIFSPLDLDKDILKSDGGTK